MSNGPGGSRLFSLPFVALAAFTFGCEHPELRSSAPAHEVVVESPERNEPVQSPTVVIAPPRPVSNPTPSAVSNAAADPVSDPTANPMPPASPAPVASEELPSCGGGEAVAVADDVANGPIAVDEQAIYYTSWRGLVAQPRDGSPLRVLGSTNQTDQIALAADSVYWPSREGLLRASKSGGEPELLHEGVLLGTAVTRGAVYFTNWIPSPSLLSRWTPERGVEELVPFAGQALVSKLLVDADYVYVMELSTGYATPTYRLRLADLVVEPLGSVNTARGFAVSRAALFVVEEGPHSLSRIDFQDQSRKTLLTFRDYPVGVAANDRHVFLTLQTLNATTHAYSGRVVRVAPDGSGACVLGAPVDYTYELALFGHDLYWIGDGRLWTVAEQ